MDEFYQFLTGYFNISNMVIPNTNPVRNFICWQPNGDLKYRLTATSVKYIPVQTLTAFHEAQLLGVNTNRRWYNDTFPEASSRGCNFMVIQKLLNLYFDQQ